MDDQKGKYNRTIVIVCYMVLVGWIAYLVATSPTFTWADAKDFIVSGVVPVVSYVLIKGPNATPIMKILAKKETTE